MNRYVIAALLIISVVIVLTVASQDFSDSEELQNAIDKCTKDINNMGTSNLESCLDNAYYQYGSAEEKQSWFDNEH